jgi:hypothetical protein
LCLTDSVRSYLASQIRWVHEIGRFEGLHPRPVAVGASFLQPPQPQLQAGQVILCEYTEFEHLPNQVLEECCSVVVDARFSRGFAVSSSAASQAEIPSELTSSTWWSKMADNKTENRILIDGIAPGSLLEFFAAKQLADRQLLEVWGLRFAFCIGANTDFVVENYSLRKSILAWGRWRVKNEESKKETTTKFERVRNLLHTLVDPFYCEMQGTALNGPTPFNWTLRRCKMTPVQRSAYGKSSRQARAVLSAQLEPSRSENGDNIDRIAAVSEALLQLRRLCLHADCNAALTRGLAAANSELLRASLGITAGTTATTMLRKGPSQPSNDIAALILDGSGKMKDLVSILVSEFEVEVADEISLDFDKENCKLTSKGKQKQRSDVARVSRIAIVASLPEARLLV